MVIGDDRYALALQAVHMNDNQIRANKELHQQILEEFGIYSYQEPKSKANLVKTIRKDILSKIVPSLDAHRIHQIHNSESAAVVDPMVYKDHLVREL